MKNKIQHQDGSQSILFQEDFLQICKGNICQALILSALDVTSSVDYIPMNYKDFLFVRYTRQTIGAAISQLLERNLIQRRLHTDSYDYAYDYRLNLIEVQNQIDRLSPNLVKEKPIPPEFMNNIGGRHQAIWDIFGGLCAYCRINSASTWDHVIPTSKNGRNIKSNLVPACRECNLLKSNLDVQEWMNL